MGEVGGKKGVTTGELFRYFELEADAAASNHTSKTTNNQISSSTVL